jgi:hypothetical protein
VDDTWWSRDLPVLDVVVRQLEDYKYQFQVNDLSTDGSLQVTTACQTSCPNNVALGAAACGCA